MNLDKSFAGQMYGLVVGMLVTYFIIDRFWHIPFAIICYTVGWMASSGLCDRRSDSKQIRNGGKK